MAYDLFLASTFLLLLSVGLLLAASDLLAPYETEDFEESKSLYASLCSEPWADPLVTERVFHGLRMGWYDNASESYSRVLNCCRNSVSGAVECVY